MEHTGALWMVVQPARDLSRPVGADGVQDQMDRLARRRLFIQQLQQFAELARTMLEADDAADLAVVDAEAGQQVDRAVAHVLELAAGRPRSGRRSTRDRRLVRRRGFADANARLLVDAVQRAIGGRT